MTTFPIHRVLSWSMRLVLIGFIIERILQPDMVAVITLSVFLLLSFGHLLREERLPNVFDVLVTLAALLNAGGFVFNWYREIPFYDNVAHTVSIFALTLAFFFLVYRDSLHSSRAAVMAVSVFTFGVTLGTLWEMAEWTTGQAFDTNVIFGLDDAITDFFSNSIGALLAALVGLWLRKHRAEEPHDQASDPASPIHDAGGRRTP